MADCIEPLLRYAKQIHFIDPYFCAIDPHPYFPESELKWQKPLQEFLKIICDGIRTVRLEYHTSEKNRSWKKFRQECLDKLKKKFSQESENELWKKFSQECEKEMRKKFSQECKEELQGIIPKGFTLTVRIWKNKPKGEKFHNRFILTNIGGVMFATGLDEKSTIGTQEDIITRLSADDFERWRNKYSGPKPAFKPIEKVVIKGQYER